MPTHPQEQLPFTVRMFTRRFASTPRGARLARWLTLRQLDAWGIPYGSSTAQTAALIVAELAANAVTHGRVPGRDFDLSLSLTAGDTLAVEVTDTCPDRRPPVTPSRPSPDAETGRGLLLVEALAARWGVTERRDGGPGKVVRAEIDC